MIKAVMFDVDGVLVNAERFSDRLAREHGISTEQTAPFFKGPFNDCLTGRADLKEVIPPHLRDWGWSGGVDSFLEYWFTSEHVIDHELVDRIQLIRAKGVKCVIATNNEKHRVDYMSTEMGFSDAFDKLYASAEIGHRKPGIEFYSMVLDEMQVEKNEVLFFDDTPGNITAANEFGINAELYTTFEDFEAVLQRYSI